MTQHMQWSFQIQVQGGPTISLAEALPIEAYERIQVTVPAGVTDKVINLVSNIFLLIVTADRYGDGDPAHKISYKINNDSAKTHDFSSALLLFSQLAVDGLANPLNSLSFTNQLTQDVVIDILTASDPTSP